MAAISVIILTKNEAENILPCLRSVDFAGEKIVVDDFSTDNTRELARKAGAIVYKRQLDNFASQRNFALTKAKYDWVFFLDADERVTPALRQEILAVLTQAAAGRTVAAGFRLARHNNIFGQTLRYTDWYPDYQLHFFRKSKGRYTRKVHEQVVVDGQIADLKTPLEHQNYDTIDQFITKNYLQYASLEAQILRSEGYHFTVADLIRKPFGEFLRRFFLRQGYRDGVHGLIASILVAFATFVVYTKVWEKEGFPVGDIQVGDFRRLLGGLRQELHYWLRRGQLDQEKNLWRRILTWLN